MEQTPIAWLVTKNTRGRQRESPKRQCTAKATCQGIGVSIWESASWLGFVYLIVIAKQAQNGSPGLAGRARIRENSMRTTMVGVWLGEDRWISLSNDFADKWVQLIIIFDPHKVIDDVTSPHGDDCGNSRDLRADKATHCKTELVTLWLNKISYKYDDRILHPSTAEINQTRGQECHKDILKLGLTPYSMAKSVWSSMSTFAMATRPFCFATAFSNLGPRILQGPHHLKNTKQKETNSINLF